MRGEAPCPGRRKPAPSETPPRAWGRHIAAIPFENAGGNTPRAWGRRVEADPGDAVRGNTPTCVGKTHAALSPNRAFQKPPRAWGRRINLRFCFLECRNTPTCVGKTSSSHPAGADRWKHPHVRGEDRLLSAALPPPLETPHVRGEDIQLKTASIAAVETPPRAWGRLAVEVLRDRDDRNTPTCVGKTPTYCERARV